MNKNGGKLGFNLSNKEKLMFVGGALYSALLIVGSYKVGCKRTRIGINKQWTDCFEEDPTLQTHIEEVAAKILNK